MGVKIELFRMMVYLSFPVAMFWISNQAEYFEEYVIKRKRELFPPNEQLHLLLITLTKCVQSMTSWKSQLTHLIKRKELEDFKERMRLLKEEQILKSISAESQN